MRCGDDIGDVDVVVVGSGGAALTAALAAAVSGGVRVLVLEASARWGGSTAVSGGQVWVPASHQMLERGVDDSPEEALRYLDACTAGRDRAQQRAFVEAAPRMARFVEDHSPIRFTPIDSPDSFAERPGGRATGRNLEVRPLTTGALGSWEELVWPPPYPPVLTNGEVDEFGLIAGGELPMELLRARDEAREVALGVGLVVGLLHGCRAAGVELHRGARVSGLRCDELGAVTGVTAVVEGEPRHITARRGVILACGGFEHDAALRRALLPAGHDHPVSPPVGTGDGLRLAVTAGAALAHTEESWSWPVTLGRGATWPDRSDTQRPDLMLPDRMFPHAIWVNQSGRRFVDESCHNCALAFADTDPATGRPSNLPAWAVADSAFRERYPLAGATPEQDPPSWVVRADTVADLATRAGIDADELATTLHRFNTDAETGHDREFGRGHSAYDRHGGDPAAAHPNLGPISRPPFYAVPIHAGMVGTKGGPRTDHNARVLAGDGAPIGGLYAAGNTMASMIGPGTVSPGATLGAALTWGWIAGCHAATSTMTSSDDQLHAALLAIDDEWARAIVSNDAEQIGAYTAEEWVIVSGSGVATREQFLSLIRSGELTHSAMDRVGEARTRVYGATAVLTARVTNTAHYRGQQFDADEWTTDVFVLRDGRWLCTLSHITPATST